MALHLSLMKRWLFFIWLYSLLKRSTFTLESLLRPTGQKVFVDWKLFSGGGRSLFFSDKKMRIVIFSFRFGLTSIKINHLFRFLFHNFIRMDLRLYRIRMELLSHWDIGYFFYWIMVLLIRDLHLLLITFLVHCAFTRLFPLPIELLRYFFINWLKLILYRFCNLDMIGFVLFLVLFVV